MAAPSVTYTFSNSTTADATQVNQNFTDIINGLSDGTKDLSINALTLAGNLSVSGNTTIGNASGDDLTVTASLASSIPITTTNSYDIGSSTLGLRALYFGANSQTVNIKGSASMSATWTLTLPVSAGSANQLLRTNGSGVSSWAGSTPTIQRFTSSSGTYTTPANVIYIRVRMVGGGGGGSGAGTTGIGSGGNGGNTTFGTNTAAGGTGAVGGATGTVGGAGGAVTHSVGTLVQSQSGGIGQAVFRNQTLNASIPAGGNGGASFFGGHGTGSYRAAGSAGVTNTGGGGGGGGADASSADIFSGAGGGGGAYHEFIIASPSASYSYAVGAAGTAGTAGTNGHAGGAGGSGVIIVEEYYL